MSLRHNKPYQFHANHKSVTVLKRSLILLTQKRGFRSGRRRSVFLPYKAESDRPLSQTVDEKKEESLQSEQCRVDVGEHLAEVVFKHAECGHHPQEGQVGQ